MKLDKTKYLNTQIFIKTRLRLINNCLKQKWTTGIYGTDIEFIALQFRKVLEEISMSSLILHRDKYSEIRLEYNKDWNARLIFQDIERLNPNFYPKPTKLEEIESGSNRYTMNFYKQDELDYLTQNQFLKTYEKCGKYLHAFNPYSVTILNTREILSEMKEWEKRLSNLIEEHTVQLLESDYIAYTKLNLGLDISPELIVFRPE